MEAPLTAFRGATSAVPLPLHFSKPSNRIFPYPPGLFAAAISLFVEIR